MRAVNPLPPKYKVAIADDERLARDELVYLLKQEAQVEIVGCAASGTETLHMVRMQTPDALFLDIHMPEMAGVDLAQKIQSEHSPPCIVFSTAYDQYAVRAFHLNAVDYLLKPYDHHRLRVALKRIEDRLFRNVRDQENGTLLHFRLIAQDGDKVVLIDPNEIVLIMKEDKIAMILTKSRQRYISKMTLSELEIKLKDFRFFRTHRAYLVHLNYIKEIIPWMNGAFNLSMHQLESLIVPVSRDAARELFRRLGRN